MPCCQSNDRFLVRWRKVRYGTLLVDALEPSRSQQPIVQAIKNFANWE